MAAAFYILAAAAAFTLVFGVPLAIIEYFYI